MDIIGSQVGRTSVLALSGALNTLSAPALSVRAIALCDTGVHTILVDLGKVPHLTSAGLRALMVINKRAEQAGVGMALCGLNEMVHDLLDVSGMLDIFRIYPDRESALVAIDRPGSP
ncbi:MAG TPA: STAS domain-containing protein [Galbitalea sp.]